LFEKASSKLVTKSQAVDGRSLGSSENAAAKHARNFPASTPAIAVNTRVS